MTRYREQRERGRRLSQGPRLRLTLRSGKKAENTRKAREAKAKAEADTVERARSWVNTKAKKKADITRVNAESMEGERAEAEARVGEKTNAVQRAVVEATAKIRAKTEARRRKIERSEAEASAKVEAEIKEKVERERNSR